MPPKPECFTEDKLISFAEAKLPAEEMRAIEAHLQVCVVCKGTLEWVKDHLLCELTDDGEVAQLTSKLANERDIPTQSLHTEHSSAYDLLAPSQAKESLGKLNEYEILKVLGRGGYGIVFEALDKILNRTVAIKVLNRDLASRAISRRRFVREARAGAAINHPNVVTIHTVNEAGDIPFLVMELVRGESLRERIRREPKLDYMDVLRISAQIAQGLAAAHAQGIIHRDVKPGNIMLVDALPRVKIADFGLARVAVENVELTSGGLAVGTPTYMSPEQVRGEEVDSRSDLFALGCVIFAMIAGHSPFHGKTVLEIARRVDGYEAPRLKTIQPGVPGFLDSIVHRLLEKDPDRRYQSAAEVADVLNRHLAILNQTPTDRLPAALKMQLAESSRSARRLSPAIALTTMLIVGIAAVGAAGFVYSRWNGKATATVGTSPSGSKAVEGTSPTASGPPRLSLVTVDQSGDADCTTITEALRKVAPGGQVTILDTAEYVEAIRLTDPEQHAGVRLSSAKGAKLRATTRGAVVAIRGVPNFRLEGFKVVAPQSQLGIEITGPCPGLHLEQIEVQRVPNTDGTRGNVAGLYLQAAAAGTKEQPIVIRGVTIHPTVVGIVIGNSDAGPAPLRHILVEECAVHGNSREHATLLVFKRQLEDVVIRRNTFARGLQGLSIVTDDQAFPVRCQVLHNTWHDVETWLVWNGPVPKPIEFEMHHNLIVDAKQLSPGTRPLSLADGVAAAFVNNLLVNPRPAEVADFSPFAQSVVEFPLLSVDPSATDFMKPDFARLKIAATATAPIPGRYSESSAQ